MKLRRLLASGALAGSLLVGLVGSVGAAPDANANCTGQAFDGELARELRPLGLLTSAFVREVGGAGHIFAPAASTNCGQK